MNHGNKKRSNARKSASMVRSSAAEYLTFVAASGEGGVEAVYADENVWLSQKMMGVLYDVDVRTINYHLKKIFSDSELDENSVIRNFRITAADGKTYDTRHYHLEEKAHAESEFEKYRIIQDRLYMSDFDKAVQNLPPPADSLPPP